MYRLPRTAAIAVLALISTLADAPAGAQETRFVHAQRFARAEGFGGAIAAALSPDGRNVYVTGFTDHSLVVLQRDPATGALTWLQTVFDGQPTLGSGRFGGTTADGLANAAQAVVSPDGEFVYTAGWSDSAIGIFERLADGRVQYLDASSDPGLDGVSDLAITADGAYLFSTSSNAGRLLAWSRHPTTGALTPLFARPGLDLARALAIAPDGSRIWVVTQDDHLFGIDFDPVTGFQTVFGANHPNSLDGAYDIVVTEGGSRLYVAAFDGNEVSFYDEGPFGHTFEESFAAPELFRPIGLASDGSRLWVSSHEAGWLLELDLDPATGAMTLAGMHGIISAAGPTGLALDAGGEHLYAAALFGAVAAFRTSPLEPISSVKATPEIGEPTSVALAPDGDGLYLGTAGAPAGIVFMRRDPESGATYTGAGQFTGAGGDQARVAISPEGTHVYAARRPSQEIEVWEVTIDGQLLPVDVVPDSTSASTDDVEAMVFHPAGEHLYLGGLPGLLALWEREADGAIDFRQSHALAAPIADIALTPDGANVYAVTGAPGSLHEFARDPETGMLTRLAPGSPVSPPYAALEAAPDPGWIYAVRPDEIVALRRQASGELTVEHVVTGGPGGDVPALVSPVDLAVSPDGRRVWALAGDPFAGAPHALISFARDPGTGLLTWLETRFASEAEIHGLDGPRHLAVSADGATLNVLSSGFLQPDPALAVFRSTRVVFADGFESGDPTAWTATTP